MKLALLFSLLSLSCASASLDNSRQPASMDDEGNERIYTQLMGSQNPEQELGAYLDRIVAIFYRAEAELKEFDQELRKSTKPGLLERSTSYPRLITLRILREQMLDKIEYIYGRLYDDRRFADSGEKNRAASALLSFHKKLLSLRRVDRIATHDLVSRLQEVVAASDEHQRRAPQPENERIESPYGKLPQAESDTALVKEVRRLRGEMDKRAAEEKLRGSFSEEMRAFQLELFTDTSREPQSQNLRPSPGPDGNITGRTFPDNTWALTYDDGPHATRTDLMLAALAAKGVKATFFELAQGVKAMPSVVARVKAAGHELANHSYTHAQLTTLGAAGLRKEIVQSTAEEAAVFGQRPKFFRLPYGAGTNNATIRQMIADEGMIHVFWNVDTLDWQDKDPASVYERTKRQMAAEKHGVILYHDIHAQTVEATKLLLANSPGVRWVTMSKIVKELNGE